jgi:hypothetical protein
MGACGACVEDGETMILDAIHPSPTLRVLSLGAGVQSTVLALLAARGEVGPMPDCAIFADTQFEPAGVYRHLDWLETQLPFPVYRVTAGDIRADHLNGLNTTGQRFASMPLYTADGHGMGRRQCTSEYKIQPIIKHTRELLGVKKGMRVPAGTVVEQWIGISKDEITRAKRSSHSYIVHRWPLLELEWSRLDCQRWFAQCYPGRELAKSACIACPYHDNAAWRAMRDNDPASWEQAVVFDAAIRESGATLKGVHAQQYVHRQGVPLDQADLRTPADYGQLSFLDECDGMCGT